MEPTPSESTTMVGAKRDFAGLRVVAFESRQSAETLKLVEKAGGVAISAPSMREVPLESNEAAFAFAAAPAGRRVRHRAVPDRRRHALPVRRDGDAPSARRSRRRTRTTTVVARGPKPVRVLRELGVPITITVPEPNTWRELLLTLDEAAESRRTLGRAHRHPGVRRRNERLCTRAHGARRRRSRRCRSIAGELPDELRPLEDAIRQVLARTVDVAALHQLEPGLQPARGRAPPRRRDGAPRSVARGRRSASVGPVCSETLVEHGFGVDFEPAHPSSACSCARSPSAASICSLPSAARARDEHVCSVVGACGPGVRTRRR